MVQGDIVSSKKGKNNSFLYSLVSNRKQIINRGRSDVTGRVSVAKPKRMPDVLIIIFFSEIMNIVIKVRKRSVKSDSVRNLTPEKIVDILNITRKHVRSAMFLFLNIFFAKKYSGI